MFQDHISFSLSDASSIGLIGVLAMLIPLFFYFAIRAIRNKVRSTIPVVPDLPTITEQQRYDALVQRMAKLFFRIDPSKGRPDLATPLTPEEARIEVGVIFQEFTFLLMDAHEAGLIQDPDFRFPTVYGYRDDGHGAMYLEEGERGRFVDYLYDQLRVDGVKRKFYDDVYESYCMMDDETEQEKV